MQNKYIRPDGLIGNTRNSKLVQNRHFISKEEYDQKVDVIKETLKTVLESLDNSNENLNTDYSDFLEKEQEINRMTNEIIQYVDKVVNEENDLEKIKFNLQKYINECVSILEKRLNELYSTDYSYRAIGKYIFDKLKIYYESNFYEYDTSNLDIKKILNDKKGNILVLLNDGSLLASGTNQNGELGLGDTNPTELGTFVKVPGIHNVDDIEIEEGGFKAIDKDGNIYHSGIIYDLIKQMPIEKKEYEGLTIESDSDDIVKLAPGTFDCFVDEKNISLVNAERVEPDLDLNFSKTKTNLVPIIYFPLYLSNFGSGDSKISGFKKNPLLLMKYNNKNCMITIFVFDNTGLNRTLDQMSSANILNEIDIVFGVLDLDEGVLIKSVPVAAVCSDFDINNLTSDYLSDLFRVIKNGKEYICYERNHNGNLDYHLFDLDTMTIAEDLPADNSFVNDENMTYVGNEILVGDHSMLVNIEYYEYYSMYNSEKVSFYYISNGYNIGRFVTKTVVGRLKNPNTYKASDLNLENPFTKLYNIIKDDVTYSDSKNGNFETTKRTSFYVNDRIKGKIKPPTGKIPVINYDSHEISLKDDTIVWPRIVYQPFVLNNNEIDNVGLIFPESHYITESVEYSGVYDVYKDYEGNDASNEPGRLFLLNKVNNRNTVVFLFQFGKQDYNGQTTVVTDSRNRTSGYIGVFDLDTSELISYKQNNPAETSNEIKYFNDAWSMYSNLFKVNSFGNNDNNGKGFICGTIYEQSRADNTDYVWRKKKVHLMDPLTLETIVEYEPSEFENLLNTSFNYINNRIEITKVNETNVIDGYNGTIMKGFDSQTNLSVYFVPDSSNDSDSGMGLGKIKESPDPFDFEIKRVDLEADKFTNITNSNNVIPLSEFFIEENNGTKYGIFKNNENYISGFTITNNKDSYKSITFELEYNEYEQNDAKIDFNSKNKDNIKGVMIIYTGGNANGYQGRQKFDFKSDPGSYYYYDTNKSATFILIGYGTSVKISNNSGTGIRLILKNNEINTSYSTVNKVTQFEKAYFSSERYNNSPKLTAFKSCDTEESDPYLFKYITTLSYEGKFTNFDFKYKQIKSNELNKNGLILIYIDGQLTDILNGMEDDKEWDEYRNGNILSDNENHKLELVFISLKGNNDMAYSVVDQLNPHTPVESIVVDENNNSPFHDFKIDTNIEIISTVDESTGERTEVLKNTGFKAVKIKPTNDNNIIRFKIKKSSSSSEAEEIGCVFLYDSTSNNCICMEPEEGGYQLPQLFDDTVKNYKIYYGDDVPDLDESFDTSNLWLLIVGEIMIGDRDGFEIESTSDSYLTIPSIYKDNNPSSEEGYIKIPKDLQPRNVAFYPEFPIYSSRYNYNIDIADDLKNNPNAFDIFNNIYIPFIKKVVSFSKNTIIRTYLDIERTFAISIDNDQKEIKDFIPIFPFYLGSTKLILINHDTELFHKNFGLGITGKAACFRKKYYNYRNEIFLDSNVYNAYGNLLKDSGYYYNAIGGSYFQPGLNVHSREWILYQCKAKKDMTTGYFCVGGNTSSNITRNLSYVVINVNKLLAYDNNASSITIYPASSLENARKCKVSFNLKCAVDDILLILMHYVSSTSSDIIRLFDDNDTTTSVSWPDTTLPSKVYNEIERIISSFNIQKTVYSGISTNENLIAENIGDIKKYEIKKGLNIFNHYGNLNDINITKVGSSTLSSYGPLGHLINSSLVYLFDVESNKIIRKLSITNSYSGKFSNISNLDENKEYKILWFLKNDLDNVYNISGFKDLNGNLINDGRDDQISILSNSYYEIENPNGSSIKEISIKCPNDSDRNKYQILYILYDENDNVEKINIEAFSNAIVSIDLEGYYKLNCLILDGSDSTSTESINNPMGNNFFNVYKKDLDGTTMQVTLPENCIFYNTGVDTYDKDALIEIKRKDIKDLYLHINEDTFNIYGVDEYRNNISTPITFDNKEIHYDFKSRNDGRKDINSISFLVKDIPFGKTPDILYKVLKDIDNYLNINIPKKYRDTLLLLKNFVPSGTVRISYYTPDGMNVEETYIFNENEIVPNSFKRYLSSLKFNNKKISIIDSSSISDYENDNLSKENKIPSITERNNKKYAISQEYRNEENLKNGFYIENKERIKCIKIMNSNNSSNDKYSISIKCDYRNLYSDNDDYILVDDIYGSLIATASSAKRRVKSRNNIFKINE